MKKNILAISMLCIVSVKGQNIEKGFFTTSDISMSEECEKIFYDALSDTLVVRQDSVIFTMATATHQIATGTIRPFASCDEIAGVISSYIHGGNSLSECKVNYFCYLDDQKQRVIIKVYKKVNLGDGVWYMEARKISSGTVTIVSDGKIFQPK